MIYARFALYLALAAVIGGSYWWTYDHGRQFERGQQAKTDAKDLREAAAAVTAELTKRATKNADSDDATHQVNANIEALRGAVRSLNAVGACVLTPERVRAINAAALAANAAGFAERLPGAARPAGRGK